MDSYGQRQSAAVSGGLALNKRSDLKREIEFRNISYPVLCEGLSYAMAPSRE
jgi:hypothetical protein